MKSIGGSRFRPQLLLIRSAAGSSLCSALFALVVALFPVSACSGQAAKPIRKEAPAEAAKPAEPEKNPAQIELLETKYQFESNGDSRKEVHARVKINSELGVRQFGRLNFDFDRGFQAVEIPLARVTHASGGVQDILPGAIIDKPNPAVVDAPDYEEVRVKTVRILGLQPGDTLEYRVITSTSRHPLAPDFWLDHSFDRAGIVSEEIFELEFPLAGTSIDINPKTPATKIEKSAARAFYRWDQVSEKAPAREGSDIVVTTFPSWDALAERLESKLRSSGNSASAARNKSLELAPETAPYEMKLRAAYDFVSRHIRIIDLPLGSTAFQPRTPDDILASGYGTMEDKYILLHAFMPKSLAALTGRSQKLADQLPSPSLLSNLVIVTSLADAGPDCADCARQVWLDPAIEVAPFGMIPANIRGKEAIGNLTALVQIPGAFLRVPAALPFDSTQLVTIVANLKAEGTLSAKVQYRLRGDNELLLRVAFQQTPKDKWNAVAQLLAISDGFRGEITNVSASDPYVTNEPFQVEYEIAQPKFVDWSKKPVRIPALLPAPGLPDPPTAGSTGAAQKPIELGTPLEIELNATVTLPAGVTAAVPTGITVDRDYAAFSSKYGALKAEYPAESNLITAQRKLHFLLPQLPASRAADFNAFLHAVQSDQSQLFVLQPPPSLQK